jgi:hypothetical protein
LDPALAVEQAFQAYATEERALYLLMLASHIQRDQADMLLITAKLQLKQELMGQAR